MPYSERQKRFFFADARRAAQGKKTETGMSEGELLRHAKEPIKKAKRRLKFKGK